MVTAASPVLLSWGGDLFSEHSLLLIFLLHFLKRHPLDAKAERGGYQPLTP